MCSAYMHIRPEEAPSTVPTSSGWGGGRRVWEGVFDGSGIIFIWLLPREEETLCRQERGAAALLYVSAWSKIGLHVKVGKYRRLCIMVSYRQPERP